MIELAEMAWDDRVQEHVTETGPAGAVAVAALVIEGQVRRGRPVGCRRLHELLYLTQGLHLLLWRRPAISEVFRAHERGPRIRAVDETYRDGPHGADVVPWAEAGDPAEVPPPIAETV